MIRRLLAAKTRLSWSGVLWGGPIGGVAMLALLARPLSNTPINLVDHSAFTQATVHDAILDLVPINTNIVTLAEPRR